MQFDFERVIVPLSSIISLEGFQNFKLSPTIADSEYRWILMIEENKLNPSRTKLLRVCNLLNKHKQPCCYYSPRERDVLHHVSSGKHTNKYTEQYLLTQHKRKNGNIYKRSIYINWNIDIQQQYIEKKQRTMNENSTIEMHENSNNEDDLFFQQAMNIPLQLLGESYKVLSEDFFKLPVLLFCKPLFFYYFEEQHVNFLKIIKN